MHRTLILIRRDTQEPDGVVSTYLDHLEDFDYDRTTHDLIEVAKEHPIFGSPHRHFHARDGQVVRKPDVQIEQEDREEAERRRPPAKSTTDVLLALINEERQANGKAMLTMQDVEARRGK